MKMLYTSGCWRLCWSTSMGSTSMCWSTSIDLRWSTSIRWYTLINVQVLPSNVSPSHYWGTIGDTAFKLITCISCIKTYPTVQNITNINLSHTCESMDVNLSYSIYIFILKRLFSLKQYLCFNFSNCFTFDLSIYMYSTEFKHIEKNNRNQTATATTRFRIFWDI